VRIKKEDEWKVAFTIPEGLFKPTVMFFGLTNSPAIFQTIMNDLLRDLINTEKVRSFIDDVMVETENRKGHDELVEEILKRMKENNLYVKPEKCKWKVIEVDFLGVVIEPDGIKIEKEKVKVVLEWPVPKSVKDIQKFLGLANYYRRFVKNFAKIVRLLHELTRKKQKWEWRIRQEKLFEVLKKRFTIEPILVALDLDKKMRIEVDTSDYVAGEVLLIECVDGK